MNRRTLMMGAAAGLASGLALPRIGGASAGSVNQLVIDTRTIDVNGKAATVFGLTGPDGKPGLTLDAKGEFHITLENRLAEETMIHWHGLTPPHTYDGVPDMPVPMLKAGQSRHFHFPVGPGGTHWMHAHTLQEQNLLAAPLIVRTDGERAADVQEVVIMLHDFSFTPAAELLANLKGGQGGMMKHGASGNGMMNGMNMQGMSHGNMQVGQSMPMDLNDINYDAYLANDRTLDDPQVVKVEAGGRVRLRIINGATATGFTIDLGSLSGTLVAVDGNAVVPLKGPTFPMTMGQRIDVMLDVPKDGGAFPVLARREGMPERTGIILATSGAAIAKISAVAEEAGPVLDLGFEAALQAASPLAIRTPDSRTMVHLMGNMMDYTWGIGGAPVKVSAKQRIEVDMMNMSMMAHPMHLHGHHFQVVAINGQRFGGAVRDTVLVPPMQTVTIAFDANNPAPAWAFHCHHLYHMASGMMATVEYEAG